MGGERSHPRLSGRLWFALAALLFLPAWLAAQASLEYQVKAAFLLNFAKFIDWPPSAFADPDSALSICIVGKDPFGRGLDDLVQGEAVNGRKLAVRRLNRRPPPKTCQIVFTQEGGKQAGDTLTGFGPGVLTVGEGDTFIPQGGMIAFRIENRHVRFDIDPKAAESANLKISSKLLSVARSVKE